MSWEIIDYQAEEKTKREDFAMKILSERTPVISKMKYIFCKSAFGSAVVMRGEMYTKKPFYNCQKGYKYVQEKLKIFLNPVKHV